MHDLTITVHHSCDRIAGLWTALERTAAGFAFQRHAWIATALETHGGPEIRPAIVLVTDRRRQPLLLLPLMVRRRYGVAVLEFVHFGLSDYNAPLIREDFAARLEGGAFPALWHRILDAVEAAAGPVDLVSLVGLPERIDEIPNPLLEIGGAAAAVSYQIPLEGDFEAYLKTRSAKLLSDTRWRRRRLSREGEVAFRVAAAPAEAARFVDAMIAQKRRRYAITGAPDLLADPRRRAFYHRLATRPDAADVVHLSALTVDGRIAAVHLGMVARGRLYWLMPTFDHDRFGHCAPGRLLLVDTLRWAFERGLHTVDLTVGDEPFKTEWADARTAIHGVVQPLTPKGRIVAGLHAGRDLVVERTRAAVRERAPRLFAAIRRIRARTLTRLNRLR